MLEAKDTGANVLPKKKRSPKDFFRSFQKKKGLQNFFSGDLQKEQVLKIIFQVIYKILTNQKIVLSSS